MIDFDEEYDIQDDDLIDIQDDTLNTKEIMKILDDAFGGEEYTDYAELQKNMILYKEGSREATDFIVKAFHRFTTKYARFVHMGHVPYTEYKTKSGEVRHKVDSSISSFVSLYTTKDDKKLYPSRSTRFSTICHRIRNLFSKYEYGDIYNEMVLALLNMADRYKITKEGDPYHKENGTFHMYVAKCFHWEAKRRLDVLVSDWLAHNECIHLVDDFCDMDLESCDAPELMVPDERAMKDFEDMIESTDRSLRIKMSEHLTIKEYGLDEHSTDALNFNWTNGVTCSELFSSLTPMEREILVLSYIQKKTIIDIADIYNCNKSTITNYKRKAITKIKVRADELNIKL
jgi:RNA polymerase sigma factor (sigma-70 family)